MKPFSKILFTLTLLFASLSSFSQNTQPDTALIRKLGADEYGMKQYVMAFLKEGHRKDIPKDSLAIIQKGHMKNIERLANEGKLIIAGPFMDDTPLRGIFIFNVSSVEEAERLTKTDPAIKAGRLSLELHPWYGSASLIESYNIHKRLQTKAF
jgi:uncharacterized protein